jgi:hypothetical protein
LSGDYEKIAQDLEAEVRQRGEWIEAEQEAKE